MTNQADQDLIRQAVNGDLGPLKEAVASRKPPMSVKSDDIGGGPYGDYNSPDDDLWTEIVTAHGMGGLSEDQYDELYDALNE